MARPAFGPGPPAAAPDPAHPLNEVLHVGS
jgi:hypothetical protein